MSNERTSKYYACLGPLGQVVCDEVSFFASKDGFPIGTYNSYEEAMETEFASPLQKLGNVFYEGNRIPDYTGGFFSNSSRFAFRSGAAPTYDRESQPHSAVGLD